MAEREARKEALEAEIRKLPDLSLTELRDRWQALYGNPAPLSLRRGFLAKAVAYQMQVEAYGDISNSTKRRLREIAKAVERGTLDATGIERKIRPGTQMIREWKGATHVVTATTAGFEWSGNSFRSLSAIAKQITGTNWNGYVFFGVKRALARNKNAAGPHRSSANERRSRELETQSRPSKPDTDRSHA